MLNFIHVHSIGRTTLASRVYGKLSANRKAGWYTRACYAMRPARSCSFLIDNLQFCVGRWCLSDPM